MLSSEKPKLYLGFTDYFRTLDDFFIHTLSERYDVIRDDENPDYLIFADETFGQTNKRFNGKNVCKIFFTGENRRFWNYDCHFAMSYDHFDFSKHFRLPLYVLDNWVNVHKIGVSDIRNVVRDGHVSQKTEGFCSFVVANGGCKERNDAFHLLSTYKKVDSGGPLFNNVGFVLPRDGINAQLTKYEFIRNRKFNLCYENGSHPGYVTEKLFHALFCNTIPIYWGSSVVEVDFNPKAFISRHDFESDEDMMKRIIEIDSNDDLYNQMLSEPILNPRNKFLNLSRFLDWFSTHIYKGQLNRR